MIPHVPCHISQTPRATIFYIWHHITPQSASHHHFTPPHLKAQHIPHHSHSLHHTIPHPQLFHTTPTFNITAHFTLHSIPHHNTPPHLDFTSPHHIWHHNTLHHFPHLTSHNNHTAHCICHILHHHNSTLPHFTSPRNFPHLALCNIPHTRTPQSTPRHIPHQTFCISIAFHITPCLKLQHSTSHHISHRTIIHIKSLHHISAHHSTSRPFHLAPHHAHHHIQIWHHTIPQHTSHTVFQLSFRITPCLIWRQTIPHHSVSVPQPYFTSCITPHHDSTSHHISHMTLHDITASHHIAHILHHTLFHITATLQNAHHTKFHTTLFYITLCDLVVLKYVKCGVMWDVWCAVPEMWFDVEYWAVVVRCGMYNALLLHLAPHHTIPPYFTLHHSTSNTNIIPKHTTLHVTPSFLTISLISYYKRQHLSQHTIPLFNTILQITPLISATLMHHATSRIASRFTFYITFHMITPHFRSHYIGHISGPHPPHLTQFSCTAFRILHNCIIPPHLTVITPSWRHIPGSTMCNGVEWSKPGQDTGSGVNNLVETTAGVWQQSVFTCSAADSFQHTHKIITLTHR